MTWEEFENLNVKMALFPEKRKKTDIECPKCGNVVYERTDIILTSYPPKKRYECDCGWVGYH